jgi:hypothetical protein
MATSIAALPIPAKTWTLLNTGGAAAGACSFFPIGGTVFIAPTASAVAPTTLPLDTVGAFELSPNPGAIINQTLAAIWPGFTTPAHVYAYAETGARVTVSCA